MLLVFHISTKVRCAMCSMHNTISNISYGLWPIFLLPIFGVCLRLHFNRMSLVNVVVTFSMAANESLPLHTYGMYAVYYINLNGYESKGYECVVWEQLCCSCRRMRIRIRTKLRKIESFRSCCFMFFFFFVCERRKNLIWKSSFFSFNIRRLRSSSAHITYARKWWHIILVPSWTPNQQTKHRKKKKKECSEMQWNKNQPFVWLLCMLTY